ncbi:ribose-5-phosphate isomerase [Candidatus Shapirobacteria bacterium CG03_land_8_20_14_0_80_40_19]|uniref:Ribose-5-phosphate isomerase n=4 Tax=Candidatus Shapironibacteriota TaxID=1752721 RepID=A0A2M7BCL1_9BACT|nr:MAG: ribose-5-phosphate isomerase [Candidatus Shapirobacteria bacterium CG11_big_fil_rev_8_21_14_0_20_40_12]PIV00846.1 MAG: ribose-5-phosphate isomerase [Candidatus Shapirobacteria bacterium CG03_land_8_20_14_0_80_40_19]PJC28600.1 MAG: ribose-5-phosphate isomerase [Candidatus Shapirobacteria bacterium CG_4_9_14_0_2_um_filter_40_11]PJC77024.1 MAG: ribose-5-phosphate isomerase [Candidatus Shapirobacteria bacterium CG_4_8_14_3_um_filter_39_11]
MIYLGADHRGYDLKEKIKKWLKDKRYEFVDFGNDKLDQEDDYPDFALKVIRKIKKEGDFGILFCGSGVGMDILANRFSHIRCGLGFVSQQIRIAKRDDNINCLVLPADFSTETEARTIIEMFLETNFAEGEKYLRRLKKIEKIK